MCLSIIYGYTAPPSIVSGHLLASGRATVCVWRVRTSTIDDDAARVTGNLGREPRAQRRTMGYAPVRGYTWAHTPVVIFDL